MFFLTIKPDRKRGFCRITPAHDRSFNKTVEYSEQLLLSQGLAFEVYKSDETEKAGIKYVEVRLSRNWNSYKKRQKEFEKESSS